MERFLDVFSPTSREYTQLIALVRLILRPETL